MKKLVKVFFYLLSSSLLWGGSVWSDETTEAKKPILTHADAAIILVKYSGFFDRYIEKDFNLNQCVAFLNKRGIYFGLLEVVNGAEFSQKDAARSFAQIDLLLSGDAEFSVGKICLPKGIDSWEEFCTMSRIDYLLAYQKMVEAFWQVQKT